MKRFPIGDRRLLSGQPISVRNGEFQMDQHCCRSYIESEV
jgi:hypothetical protein